MAECVVIDDQLVVRLSMSEKLESVHRDVAVPLASIRSVEVVDNALDYIHGMKVGAALPGTMAVGTFTSRNAKIFGAIHHSEHRGVRIVLEGTDFDELLVGCANPETVASQIPVAS